MKQKHATARRYFLPVCLIGMAVVMLVQARSAAARSVPAALETFTAEDGSIWERVSEPGFGNSNNICIVSLCPYQGSLYALVRNEATGAELWRSREAGWEQISIPGFSDSVLHELMNAAYGKLIEFKGSLYMALGSGYEGAFLYRSIGCEIWRFDGETWEPLVSNSKDADEAGTITALAGCEAADGSTTAEVTDSGKTWPAGQWSGGILRITSGEGKGRVFAVTGNTATTLTVQQNEEANTGDDEGNETEYTLCEGHVPDPDYPNVPVGTVAAGDSYEIGIGRDENGFGEIWNKNFIDMAVLDGELYVGISHNYEDGTRVWKTADGTAWEPSSPYAFGIFHGFDPDGNPTGECLISGLEDTVGNPVCSSATHFGKTDVSGTETLYIGGTGSSGCNGRGARAFRLDGTEWNAIVDNFVDDNDEGTNESGFGDAGDFINANFQAWTWAEYDDAFFVGIARVTGGRIMYSATGGPEDGAWSYAAGGDSAVPDGFDGVADFLGYGANIGTNLYTFDSALYAGTLKVKMQDPIPGISPVFDGADIWRATGPADSLVWTRITGDGFGDDAINHFEAFTAFEGDLYVAASNLFSGNAGQTIPDRSGGKLYRLKEVPQFVSVRSFSGSSGSDGITLRWATDAEPDCTGFNVLRSDSEAENSPYVQINDAALPARGAGSEYTYVDSGAVTPGDRFYRIEAVSSTGAVKAYGPVAVSVPCPAARIYGAGSPQAELLRRYRDRVLSVSSVGRACIRSYYRLSPHIERIISSSPAAGNVFRTMLDALLPLIEKQI